MVALVLGLPVCLLLGALGIRVLRQARRHAAVTDALLGVFFLALGIGVLPAMLAQRTDLFPGQLDRWLMAIGQIAVIVGFAALLLFSWRCFGRSSAWRRALAYFGVAALGLAYLGLAFVDHFDAGGRFIRLTALLRAAALIWTFLESLAYAHMMRRRVTIGLAQPIVADRFFLWTVWTGSLLAAICIAIAVRFLMPDFGVMTPFYIRVSVIAAFCGLGTLSGAALWLSFFPPDWYVARIARRSATAH